MTKPVDRVQLENNIHDIVKSYRKVRLAHVADILGRSISLVNDVAEGSARIVVSQEGSIRIGDRMLNLAYWWQIEQE